MTDASSILTGVKTTQTYSSTQPQQGPAVTTQPQEQPYTGQPLQLGQVIRTKYGEVGPISEIQAGGDRYIISYRPTGGSVTVTPQDISTINATIPQDYANFNVNPVAQKQTAMKEEYELKQKQANEQYVIAREQAVVSAIKEFESTHPGAAITYTDTSKMDTEGKIYFHYKQPIATTPQDQTSGIVGNTAQFNPLTPGNQTTYAGPNISVKNVSSGQYTSSKTGLGNINPQGKDYGTGVDVFNINPIIANVGKDIISGTKPPSMISKSIEMQATGQQTQTMTTAINKGEVESYPTGHPPSAPPGALERYLTYAASFSPAGIVIGGFNLATLAGQSNTPLEFAKGIGQGIAQTAKDVSSDPASMLGALTGIATSFGLGAISKVVPKGTVTTSATRGVGIETVLENGRITAQRLGLEGIAESQDYFKVGGTIVKRGEPTSSRIFSDVGSFSTEAESKGMGLYSRVSGEGESGGGLILTKGIQDQSLLIQGMKEDVIAGKSAVKVISKEKTATDYGLNYNMKYAEVSGLEVAKFVNPMTKEVVPVLADAKAVAGLNIGKDSFGLSDVKVLTKAVPGEVEVSRINTAAVSTKVATTTTGGNIVNAIEKANTQPSIVKLPDTSFHSVVGTISPKIAGPVYTIEGQKQAKKTPEVFESYGIQSQTTETTSSKKTGGLTGMELVTGEAVGIDTNNAVKTLNKMNQATGVNRIVGGVEDIFTQQSLGQGQGQGQLEMQGLGLEQQLGLTQGKITNITGHMTPTPSSEVPMPVIPGFGHRERRGFGGFMGRAFNSRYSLKHHPIRSAETQFRIGFRPIKTITPRNPTPRKMFRNLMFGEIKGRRK